MTNPRVTLTGFTSYGRARLEEQRLERSARLKTFAYLLHSTPSDWKLPRLRMWCHCAPRILLFPALDLDTLDLDWTGYPRDKGPHTNADLDKVEHWTIAQQLHDQPERWPPLAEWFLTVLFPAYETKRGKVHASAAVVRWLVDRHVMGSSGGQADHADATLPADWWVPLPDAVRPEDAAQDLTVEMVEAFAHHPISRHALGKVIRFYAAALAADLFDGGVDVSTFPGAGFYTPADLEQVWPRVQSWRWDPGATLREPLRALCLLYRQRSDGHHHDCVPLLRWCFAHYSHGQPHGVAA